MDQRIKVLEKKRGDNSDSESSFDIDSLQKYLVDYAKKSELKDYFPKNDGEELNRKLSSLEAKIDRWEPDWSQMQSDIRYLMESLY